MAEITCTRSTYETRGNISGIQRRSSGMSYMTLLLHARHGFILNFYFQSDGCDLLASIRILEFHLGH